MPRANSRSRNSGNTTSFRRTIRTSGVLRNWPGPNSAMETLEQIKSRVEAAIPGARLEIVPNDSPSGQRSFLLDAEHAVVVAKFLRYDVELRLDYCSNATGVDWLDAELTEKTKVKKLVDGVEK